MAAEQDWTDDQSVSSDNSERSFESHEWNTYIADRCLFYIKFNLVYQAKPVIFDDDLFFRNEYRRLSIRKKENILSKFGHREKNRYNLFKVGIIDIIKKEQLNGINKEIIISIAPTKNITVNNVIPLSETILGITTSLFPDGKKLMVEKIRDYSVFNSGKIVKPKDWIKSVDAEMVTVDNFEFLLEASTVIPTIVKITFFEMVENDLCNAIEIKITCFADMIQSQETLFNKDDTQTLSSNDEIFSMIYISNKYTKNDELDVKFCYPIRGKNVLLQSKGSFVTLHSIFNSSFGVKISMTNLQIDDNIFYIAYNNFEDGILLLGFNSLYLSVFSVKQKSLEINRLLNALYSDCSHMFDSSSENNTQIMHLCDSIRHSIKIDRNKNKFENTFHLPCFVPLPKEIQLRIDDALGELEAMDYRNWNDDLVDLFCDLTIIGCCLYYNQYLITSHLHGEYLTDVETILKNLGILEVVAATEVKNIAIWRKFYPRNYYEHKFYKGNDAYILVISVGHLLMVVILEVPANSDHNKSFSRYIEEIQDMLEYFKSSGMENLVRIWIDTNRRPHCIHTSVSIQESVTGDQRLGTKNNDEDSNASNSLKNHTVKDEGLNGREDDDDSDWGQSLDSSQRSSSFDIIESPENNTKEFSKLIPSMLTFGNENLLYYYVQLEVGEGIFLAPVLSYLNNKHDIIMNTFRRTCTIIHSILQNTKKFKEMLSSDESSKITSTHRSSIAVKEQGMLMTVPEGGSKSGSIEFWVLGRLFSAPSRELYVCHRSDAPQNMIELAFRINLTYAG